MNADSQNVDADGSPAGGGLAVTDIYYVLFRRKWFIVLGLLLGLLAAGALWKLRQPPFVSDAKILVNYVVDRTAAVPTGGESQINRIEDNGASVIGSEIEILTSQDIALEVARKIGPGRIVSSENPSNAVQEAAAYILRKLSARQLQRTRIIYIEFQHKKADVTREVLHEMIAAYLKKHDDVHMPRISDDTLHQQAEQLRISLTNVESRLKILKEQANVSSIADSKAAFIKLVFNVQQELLTARADLAQRSAALKAMQGAGVKPSGVSAADVPPDKLDEYKFLITQQEVLSHKLAELQGLAPTAPQMATNLIKLNEVRVKKSLLESNFPALPKLMLPPNAAISVAATPANDPAVQEFQVKALESKALELSNQLTNVQAQLKKIEDVENEVGDLERLRATLQKQLEQIQLRRQEFALSATLEAGKSTPVRSVQEPSPPSRDFAQLFKKLGMAVGGGIAFGIALAFLFEMMLDRNLKRPRDVENIRPVPLFLSIPYTRLRGLIGNSGDPTTARAALPAPSGGGKTAKNGSSEAVVPADLIKHPEPAPELKPYHDALRDRLMNYFDVRDMTHKPKLIAVTSCRDGAGVSTVAGGLAASLSETGDGNVLLVDMRGSQGAAHAFYHGKPALGVAEALEDDTRGSAMVNENLYVVSAGSLDKKLERVLPKQFSQFVPKLKASDYDYIIFDMPPVAQTSVTAKVARFMDMVLMVVESENTDKDAARKAGALLADANATVATVLNKQRSYVPGWLHQELQ